MQALSCLPSAGRSTSSRCVRSNAAQPICRREAIGLVAAGLSWATAVVRPAQARQQQPANKDVEAAESPYIQELLRRSRENKEKYDKERLQDYYKRNFKDYFEYESGNIQAGAARGLSEESQQAIQKWLQDNK